MSPSSQRLRRSTHRLVLAVTALGLTLPTAVLVASPAEARTGSKLTVSGPKKAKTQKRVKFTGKVRSGNKRRVIRVHVRHKSNKKWKLARTVRTNKNGRFTFRVGTGKKAGKRLVRITAPRNKKFKRGRTIRRIQVRRPAPKGLRVQWRRTNVIAGKGKPFRVTGNVPRGWKGRQVVLQRKRHGGWMRASATRIKPNGSFVLTARSNWLHTQPYRIRITNPKGRTLTRRHKFKARPNWKPQGRASSWAHLRASDNTRLRWDPCGPAIRYRVNMKQSQAGQNLADVKRAVRHTALASGLRFKFQGHTDVHAWSNDTFPSDTDLVISWSNNNQALHAPFGAGSNVIGYGGLSGYYTNDSRGRVIRAERGDVALRSNYNWQGSEQMAYGLLLHELGHAVGLGHVDDPSQVMNPFWWPQTPKRWAKGDLTGLTRSGLAQGCLPDPNRNGGSVRAFGDDHDHNHGETPGLDELVSAGLH